MARAKKLAMLSVLAVLSLLVVGLLAVFCLILYAQHTAAQKIAIHTPNGIQEGMYVSIGGIDQWIQIRGDDRDNPVLLFVHGGPGASVLATSSGWRPWEKYFTVVLWEQRGTGRTYRKTGRSVAHSMTIPRMTQDGIEVAEFLLTHLHKRKILLVAHSWGSILGIYMIKQRPDLFAAYVGTGQVVNLQKNEALNYAHVLAEAQAEQNREALQDLTSIGPPPYNNIRKIGIERKWADTLGPRSGDDVEPRINAATPGFSLLDIYYFHRGFDFSQEQLFGEHADGPAMQVDLTSLGSDFAVPIFFFEGTADQQTPIELAEQYFEQIRAPHKEFVRFEGDHHSFVLTQPSKFLEELLKRVRPLTTQAD